MAGNSLRTLNPPPRSLSCAVMVCMAAMVFALSVVALPPSRARADQAGERQPLRRAVMSATRLP